MADLYSILSSIEPDQQDIVEAEFLAKQILEANFPDLDLREGTAARDLAVRPGAFLLALCKKGFDTYFAQNKLSNVDDTTPTEVVDDIMSNLFVTRNLGTYAIISARLYFSVQKSITLSTSTSFSTDGALIYYPQASTVITSDQMLFDSYQNEWYVDVDLQAAATGAEYNLSSGSLLYFSNFDPFFLHAEINYLAQTSIGAETNTQFVARASSSISTRNLINLPSISSNIRNTFNYITRVDTVGGGDERIYRDQVKIKGATPWTKLSSAAAMADSGAHLQLTIYNHGLIPNQLVDLLQVGTGVQMRNVPVYQVIDLNNFTVTPTVSGLTDPQKNYWVTPTEPDVWAHNAGSVDVHVGDSTSVTQSQITFNSNGNAILNGPIYKIERVPGTGDTVATNKPYSIYFPTLKGNAIMTMGGVTINQDAVTNVVTCTTTLAHPLVVGRVVNIQGWPYAASNFCLPVTQIIDGYNFILGSNLGAYGAEDGTTPSISFVNPPFDVGFSSLQQLTVSGGGAYAGGKATFNIYKINNVDNIHSYLTLSTNRVVTGDLLARGYDLYVLDIPFITYAATAPTSGAVVSALSTYLSTLNAGQDFVVSDMITVLGNAGITELQTPVNITYTLYSKDMFSTIGNTITALVTDRIQPWTSTSVFILGNITITTSA